MKAVDKLIEEIQTELSGKSGRIEVENVGYVREVKDEVIILEGFKNVSYGELIEFESGASGLVIDLQEDLVGSIAFGDFTSIKEGDKAKGTGSVFSVPVGENLVGRVVSGVGEPIDGLGKIKSKEKYPVERIASSVVYRQPVNQPIQTGIKAVDAAIPIGRGQRELIIGDRGTGKSTIAIDTILNQKGQDVICIYCIVGQKRSNAATIVDLLKREGAMDYSIVVAATASDPASMQYVAPYAATAIAEYFMDQGKDALVIYDDLTKHAWAYRQVSLVLRRPSGREAYPGDIFYLHSRLLERSCKMADKYGGGSITALPIIETQEGDVSAYIPTNVISITDGQIFLEKDLFNAGVRPAINVGTSVSRVGSKAQVKAMKKVGGQLRLDLAQYREMAAFAQFESELDARTKQFLDRGARMTELLKQAKHDPMPLSSEVMSLWLGTQGYLDNIKVSEVAEFERSFLDHMQVKHKKILSQIDKEKDISDKLQKELKNIADKFIKLRYPQDNELQTSKKKN